MKKFSVFFVAVLMSLSFVGCGSEEETQGMSCGALESNTKSMVVFDEKEFLPDEAYATVYYGVRTDPGVWKHFDQVYAYAFFFHGTLDEYTEDMRSVWKDPNRFERETSLYEEILSKPLNELTSLTNLEKPVFIVHHEKGKEKYLAKTFDTEETHDNNTGLTTGLKFKYSQQIKLPAEFFTEEEGDFSLIYQIKESWSSEEYKWYSLEGGEKEYVNGHYRKRRGKIVLDDKVLLDEKFRDVQILNLEE